jgi:hypothetical protein
VVGGDSTHGDTSRHNNSRTAAQPKEVIVTTNITSVSNPVPTSIIADSFACAMAVMENHEQRIGKTETTVQELGLIGRDDIANAVVKQVSAEQIADRIDCEEVAEHVSISDIADHIDREEVAQAMDIDLSDLADNIDKSDLADHIDMDDVASEAAERIDLYSLARELDTSDIAQELDVADVAGYMDVDDVAANISIPEVAEQIVDNMKEGLSGSMVDAMVKAVNERDVLRELVVTLKQDVRRGQADLSMFKDQAEAREECLQDKVKDLQEVIRNFELDEYDKNGIEFVHGADPNDAAPTPEVSNG